MSGRLIGVGTGPGDPDLLTLKALKALQTADMVAHFAKAGRRGQARTIVHQHLRVGCPELSLDYPVTTELPHTHPDYTRAIDAFFDQSAAAVATYLEAGAVVAVLSEGDPLFYGSYMHLHVRLASRFDTEIIPGVTSMSGCWSLAGLPLAQGDDTMLVCPGTLPEDELVRRLTDADAAVILKLGRNLPKVRRALTRVQKLDQAMYVERGTMAGGFAMPLADKRDDVAPYFSQVLVPGWRR